jgi:hypothetical protein
MTPTSGHTATYKGRRCTVVMLDGSTITGRFVERTLNGRIRIRTASGIESIDRANVKQFLAGNGTRRA